MPAIRKPNNSQGLVHTNDITASIHNDIIVYVGNVKIRCDTTTLFAHGISISLSV